MVSAARIALKVVLLIIAVILFFLLLIVNMGLM
jgi:hypothetical protein